jgi:hypothetical protein
LLLISPIAGDLLAFDTAIVMYDATRSAPMVGLVGVVQFGRT